jgi:hypothetical protein
MSETTFNPPRGRGMLLHIFMVLLSAGGGGIALWLAVDQGADSFLLLVVAAVALFIPLPVIVYRAYALMQASYALERDGLRLRWGLRAEDIPLLDVEWVRPADELGYTLPLPVFTWPGALLGTRHVEGLGEVEFMAAGLEGLLLVATPNKVYAISPADGRSFLRVYQRITEMGSISPIAAYSAQPAAYLQRVWTDQAARGLALAGLAATAVLFIASGIIISIRDTISLGFDPQGLPVEPGPAERLLLLPVVAVILYMVDLIGGLFLYRFVERRAVAYLLWAGSIVTPVALLLSVLYLAWM